MRLAPLLLLLAACATSAPPPPPAPAWTEVPASVLNVFCSRLHDEGISAETPIEVVKTTQALISPETMNGLAEASFYEKRFDPYALAEEANRGAAALPVAVPRGPCTWRAVEQSARRSHDLMTIELSPPFRNPFVRRGNGLLARVSLGRDAATWYWVPVAQRDGRWVVGTPMLLAMR